MSRTSVGADAHIGPAGCTGFTVVCGEFATSQRVDVGIGPYSQEGKCNTNSKAFVFAAACRLTSQPASLEPKGSLGALAPVLYESTKTAGGSSSGGFGFLIAGLAEQVEHVLLIGLDAGLVEGVDALHIAGHAAGELE